MGATLGHLVIYNFNISQKELLICHDSIDYSTTNPIDKASKINSPLQIFNFVPTWSVNDIIVTVISVPTVVDPMVYVLKYDNLNVIEKNESHITYATTIKNQERFYQDETYNEYEEPYITEIGLDFTKYKTSEFKIITINEILFSIFNINKNELFIKKIKVKSFNDLNNVNDVNDDKDFEKKLFDSFSPSKLLEKFPNWNKSDKIAIIFGVNLGSKPKGYILSCDQMDKFVPNENYSVLINEYSSHIEKFNNKYDPKVDPYILKFQICNTKDNINLDEYDCKNFNIIIYEFDE